MQFGTRADGQVCLLAMDGTAIPLNGSDGPQFASLQAVVDQFDTAKAAFADLTRTTTPERMSWETTLWQAPIPQPNRNIFCVGKNYVEHAAEFHNSGFDASATGSDAVPSHPILFTKTPETVIGPDADIVVPQELTQQVDYEAEIAVVIGKAGRFIPADSAMDHVFGFTLLNDVTARDLQQQQNQWFLGKAIETFCPMGPYVVTKDAVYLSTLTLSCHVNGERRQHAPAQDMIFSIAEIIEVLSKSVHLLSGDIIATGTPAGVGIGMSTPRFLTDGDVVTVSAIGLGTLSNRVRVILAYDGAR